MKRSWLAFVLVLPLGCAIGCNRGAPKAGDPDFDRKWSDLEKATEPAFIEGETHGAGLVGEVRRAVDSTADLNTLSKDPLPGALPDPEVVKVIRANLAAVKGCYAVEERNGAVGSGKAIVTLEIDKGGSVANVKVDAPAFAASQLPECVSGRARAWTFPKVSQGPKRFSYPFVFVGG
jgi:hypothetical protein